MSRDLTPAVRSLLAPAARILLAAAAAALLAAAPGISEAPGAPPAAPAAAWAASAVRRPIELAVDATDVRRGMLHAELAIPAAPGPLALAYPKWIQGEHTPTGPITQLAGLSFAAAGRRLTWRRDPLEPFVFRVEVPPGADAVTVELDYLSPPASFGSGYGEGPNVTPHVEVLDWNDLLLYRPGPEAGATPVRARVRLPAGWKFDTALHVERAGPAAEIAFAPTTLYTLLDSPLLAGDTFRTIELSDPLGAAPLRISMAADRPEAFAVAEARLAAWRRLPAEAAALFGARHFGEYHWLAALSDAFAENGVEHHESCDVRGGLGLFTDPALLRVWGGVLAHEYVHAWNGKYRRPEGLAAADPLAPLRTGLLWIYEGLTRYLGELVLTARTGIRTPEQSGEYIAYVAAMLEHDRPGRRWRPLADDAAGVPAFDGAPGAWTSWRRGADYYDEGMLIWLEADTVLRRHGSSLDAFCRAFFGGPSGPAAVVPYTAEDVYAALGRLAPYNWRGFFAARVEAVAPHAPLGGVEAAGWRLVFDGRPNVSQAAREASQGVLDRTVSLGLLLRGDGGVADVVPGSPAWAAGFGPGMKIVALGGVKWSPAALADALETAAHGKDPIAVTVEQGDAVRVLAVDYHGGARYPHLERDPSRPDLLAEILAPRHPAAAGGHAGR